MSMEDATVISDLNLDEALNKIVEKIKTTPELEMVNITNDQVFNNDNLIIDLSIKRRIE